MRTFNVFEILQRYKRTYLTCIIHKNLKKSSISQVIMLLRDFFIKTDFFKFLNEKPSNVLKTSKRFSKYSNHLREDPSYIQNLVDDIIYKDIAAVQNIRNTQILRDFFFLLMERAGKQISINKIASILKISPDTSRRYFDYFKDSYLIYPVTRHGKTNERLLSPGKIYAPDIGIRSFYTGFRDIGSLFENYVYLKIKHLKPQYVYQNTVEIDFITNKNDLIEAKFHDQALSPKQKKIFDNYNTKQKFIIRTHEQIEDFLTGKQTKNL